PGLGRPKSGRPHRETLRSRGSVAIIHTPCATPEALRNAWTSQVGDSGRGSPDLTLASRSHETRVSWQSRRDDLPGPWVPGKEVPMGQKTSTARPEPVLFLDDHRGIYIPRDFAEAIDPAYWFGVSQEELGILADPDPSPVGRPSL